jgi:hypothetical protein
MTEFYKSVTYLVFAFIICLFAQKIESSFINDFSNNFIGLLTTLLAINIASSSLIASKLKEISIQTGHGFDKTKKELKRSLSVQLILIALSFIILLFRTSKVISNIFGTSTLLLVSNTFTVAIFIYYLDTIKDLGRALFSLLDFEEGKNNLNK